MDNFEKQIFEMRNELHTDEPDQGHFDRFEIKLDKGKQKVLLNRTYLWPAIAAIFVLGFFLFRPATENKQKQTTLGEVSDQYAQVEYYYTTAIQQKTEKIKALNEQLGPDNAIQLLVNELEEYDQVYEQLCTDLNAAPNDQRVINALIAYYQTKLEISQKILENIQLKPNSNENTEI
ncbi:MAG TPA: hypothetical protein PLS94_02120 [Prolixibacteraceae bacterium]|nr:hypothetical protein [Prolixibacteraceae bacterium]